MTVGDKRLVLTCYITSQDKDELNLYIVLSKHIWAIYFISLFHEPLGCDRLVTSRSRILLPRRRNFAFELIKNCRLLSTKLYIWGNVFFLSAPTKIFVT